MKKRGQINGCQQKRGKTQLLLWLNIRAIKGEEAIRDRLYWLCDYLCFYFKERHVCVERFWSLAPTPRMCLVRQSERTIAFKYVLSFHSFRTKEERLWEKLHTNSSRQQKTRHNTIAPENPLLVTMFAMTYLCQWVPRKSKTKMPRESTKYYDH